MTAALIGIAAFAVLFVVVGLMPLATKRCGDCVDGDGCALDDLAPELDELAGGPGERSEMRR
jgi:hypothetical protein